MLKKSLYLNIMSIVLLNETYPDPNIHPNSPSLHRLTWLNASIIRSLARNALFLLEMKSTSGFSLATLSPRKLRLNKYFERPHKMKL